VVVSGIDAIARARPPICDARERDSATIYTSGLASRRAHSGKAIDARDAEEDAMKFPMIFLALALALTIGVLQAGAAENAGQIKVSKGAVQIERSGERMPAPVGSVVQQGDLVITGADGSVGITFRDNSLLSVGPDSVLSIDRFVFDSTTHQGAFESSLKQGTLAVVSGKLAKQSPESMKVRTPAAILGVRGTEFLVRTGPKD
jgi:hypothetical protein